MTVLYMDGFDHYYTTGDSMTEGTKLRSVCPNIWSDPIGTSNNGHGNMASMSGLSSPGLKLRWISGTGGGYRCRLPKAPVSGETWIVGFHMYLNNLPATTSNPSTNERQTGNIVYWALGSGLPLIGLHINNSAQLELKSGVAAAPTGVRATSTNTVAATTLYYVELKINFHASTGTMEVRVNGAVWATASSLNTMTSSMEYLYFCGDGASGYTDNGTVQIDNLVVMDSNGSYNNDYLGERKIQTIFPDADASPEQWTLSTGSDSYALVDNVPYTSAGLTASAIDDTTAMELPSLPSPGFGINAIQINTIGQKTEAGPSQYHQGIRLSGGEYWGSSISPALNTPNQFFTIYEKNPLTAADWTPAEIAGAQAIIEKVA